MLFRTSIDATDPAAPCTSVATVPTGALAAAALKQDEQANH